MGAGRSSLSDDLVKQDIAECKKLLEIESLKALWLRIDFNGNGYVSLAEIDKMVVDMASGNSGPFKDFDNKPALPVSRLPPPLYPSPP